MARLNIRTDTDTTLGSIRCPELIGEQMKEGVEGMRDAMDKSDNMDIVDSASNEGELTMRITHKPGAKKEPAVTFRRWQALKAIKAAHDKEAADVVSEREWRSVFYETTDAQGDNKRKAFERSIAALVAAGYVEQVDRFSYRLVEGAWAE